MAPYSSFTLILCLLFLLGNVYAPDADCEDFLLCQSCIAQQDCKWCDGQCIRPDQQCHQQYPCDPECVLPPLSSACNLTAIQLRSEDVFDQCDVANHFTWKEDDFCHQLVLESNSEKCIRSYLDLVCSKGCPQCGSIGTEPCQKICQDFEEFCGPTVKEECNLKCADGVNCLPLVPGIFEPPKSSSTSSSSSSSTTTPATTVSTSNSEESPIDSSVIATSLDNSSPTDSSMTHSSPISTTQQNLENSSN